MTASGLLRPGTAPCSAPADRRYWPARRGSLGAAPGEAAASAARAARPGRLEAEQKVCTGRITGSQGASRINLTVNGRECSARSLMPAGWAQRVYSFRQMSTLSGLAS